MGKDLKGKELGTGISQRPDGNYMARFVDRYKKRHTLYDRDLKALKVKLERAKWEMEFGVYEVVQGQSRERDYIVCNSSELFTV